MTTSSAPEAVYPLSPLQRGMLFHSLYAPATDDYVEQVSTRIDGPLDTDAFRAAWQAVVARHAVLRTSFHVLERSEPAQVVHREVTLPWTDLDWSDLPADEQATRWTDLLAADHARGFAADAAPLMRCTLVRLADDVHRLIWTHHHLLLDGWSVPIVLRDLATVYDDRRAGRPTTLSAPAPYRAYIDWLKQQDPAPSERFWRARLAGVEAPTPLPGRHRPGGGSDVRLAATVELDAGDTAALTAFARTEHLTVGTLISAAWAIVLARHAGTDDVVFGTTVAGRPAQLPGVEDTVGMFINSLPVRVRHDRTTPVRVWLGRLHRELFEQRAHEHTALTDLQGWTSVPRSAPLFETLVVHENQPLADQGSALFHGIEFTELRATARTNYPLTLVSLPGARHRLQLLHDPDQLDAAGADALLRQVACVLHAMVQDPDGPVPSLPLSSPVEQHRAAELGTGVRTPYPADRSLFDAFLAVARSGPDRTAVVEHDVQTTYGALLATALRTATALRAAGVGAGSRVAVVGHRSTAFVADVLAVLAVGATYVPLDPSHPEARSIAMADDAGVRAVLGDRGATIASALRVPHLGPSDTATVAPLDPVPTAGGGATAYLMYTSGSTGRPKGIAVPHRAVLRLVLDTDYVRLAPDDRIAFAANTAFDATTFEIWGGLLNAAALVVVDRDQLLAPAACAVTVAEQAVTTMFVTTALFNQIAAAEPSLFAPLRTVLFGGETVDVRAVAAVRRAGPPARLVHVYGPTETTTFATWHLVDSATDETTPIGRPIANSTAHVLDTTGAIAADDLVGELYLGGDGLADGYPGLASLTALRFVPDPFTDRPGGRLYRTGDLVRRDRAGDLVFVGRDDGQIKLRGHRIELGEIEATLRADDAVHDAHVLVRTDRDDPRLVAYVVAPDAGPELPDALRRRCGQSLPEHFVPSAVVVVDTFPLTPNGKIDRAALPAAEPTSTTTTSAPLRDGVEQVVAAAWTDLLGVAAVSPYDNFFDLGGHSLLATRLQVRLRSALGTEIPLRAVFEAADLRDLAARVSELRGARGSEPAALPSQRRPTAPLSYSQQRLWFLEQWDPGTAMYHITGALRLRGALDVPGLRAVLTRIAARHDALRTTFGTGADDGDTVQRIAAPGPVAVPLVDLSALPDPLAAFPRTVDAALRTPFDLATGPLWRLVLIRLGPDDHGLALAMHHLVSDGRSLDVFVGELAAGLRGSPLPDVAAQHSDYARWQRDPAHAGELDAELSYWRDQLAGVAEITLPGDHRPSQPQRRAAVESVRLDDADRRLRALGARAGTTAFMTTFTVFAVTLALTRELDEVVVGTPVAGRHREELDDIIGFFVNTVVLRLGVGVPDTFLDVLRRAREVCLGAYDHQRVPFDRVVAARGSQRERLPLFQTWFVLHDDRAAPDAFPGLQVEPISSPDHEARYELRLDLNRSGEALRATFEYRADLFDASSIARLARRFTAVFDAVCAEPTIRLDVLADRLAGADSQLRAERRESVTLAGLRRLQTTRRRAVAATDPLPGQPAGTTNGDNRT